MKKHLHKLWFWVKSIFVKEVHEEIQKEVQEDIPVEDAFRMWKEQQRKESEKPLSYGEVLKRYLDSKNLFRKE